MNQKIIRPVTQLLSCTFIAMGKTGKVNIVYLYNISGPVQLSRYSDWLRAGRSGDRIPVGVRYSAPIQTGPGAHPASCTMDTGSFPGVKSGRGVTLTPHPLLVPLVMKEQSYTSTPLWAVRPVQSLSACTRVTFSPYSITSVQAPVPATCERTMQCRKTTKWWRWNNVGPLEVTRHGQVSEKQRVRLGWAGVQLKTGTCDLCKTPCVVKIVKCRLLQWAGYVARMVIT